MAVFDYAIRGEHRFEEVSVSGSTSIDAGNIVAVNATGYAVAGGNTAGLQCLGLLFESVDNSSGDAGDLKAKVFVDGEVRVQMTGSHTINDHGKRVRVHSATACALSGGNDLTTEGVTLGKYIQPDVDDSTKAWVRIEALRTDPDLT